MINRFLVWLGLHSWCCGAPIYNNEWNLLLCGKCHSVVFIR